METSKSTRQTVTPRRSTATKSPAIIWYASSEATGGPQGDRAIARSYRPREVMAIRREDRKNRWHFLLIFVFDLLLGWLPAYSDRQGIWPTDVSAIDGQTHAPGNTSRTGARLKSAGWRR